MLRFYQAFSVELPIAAFLALVLIVLRILRTIRKGEKAGVGWYVAAALLLLLLIVIVFLTVTASTLGPVATPCPSPDAKTGNGSVS